MQPVVFNGKQVSKLCYNHNGGNHSNETGIRLITTFNPNLVIKLMFSGMRSHILAICTFLGTVILSDEVYIPEV